MRFSTHPEPKLRGVSHPLRARSDPQKAFATHDVCARQQQRHWFPLVSKDIHLQPTAIGKREPHGAGWSIEHVMTTEREPRHSTERENDGRG